LIAGGNITALHCGWNFGLLACAHAYARKCHTAQRFRSRGHLNCRYLTGLDIAVANGALAKPAVWDPLLEILVERGARHEAAYIEHLAASGFAPVVIEGAGVSDAAVAQTLDAMKAGAGIIVQGALRSDRWSGRTDILRRVEVPSIFGPWSYEVIDTKLARETKGGTVLQLCVYSALLAATQKHGPEFAYVVAPGSGFEPQQFRVADYAAYFRRVRASLEQSVDASETEAAYPDPKEHCEICRWRNHCDTKRRADDHPSLVANISKAQISELANEILKSNATWTDRNGVEMAIALEDVLVIAPYNAQVFELQERLPGARIGTVDKFQGQEAPVVIYSMTTSTYADAPRGMEFLYSSNRLNVATSRARCVCILVG
jgi:hypothetical protein